MNYAIIKMYVDVGTILTDQVNHVYNFSLIYAKGTGTWDNIKIKQTGEMRTVVL